MCLEGICSCLDCGIEDFRICIDIEDRERLHDYISGQTLIQPAKGGWSSQSFKGLEAVDTIGGNTSHKQQVVELMDKTILDTSFLETQVESIHGLSQEPFQERSGVFYEDLGGRETELPNRVLPIYKPGETIHGKVVLLLSEPVDANGSITIWFLGQAWIQIHMYHKFGYFEDTKKQVYADEECTLWKGSEEDLNGAGLITEPSDDELDTAVSVQVREPPTEGKMLAPGYHEFPFEFTIPENAAQSMPPLVHTTINYVHLMYRLKAKVDFGNLFGRGNVVTHKGLWVEKEVDIGADVATPVKPVTITRSLETGITPFSNGKVTVTASLENSRVVKGEPIPVTFEVDNKSGGEICSVRAQINLAGYGEPRLRYMRMEKTVDLRGRGARRGPIQDGQSTKFILKVPWKFNGLGKNGALLPVGRLNDTAHLRIAYSILITVERPCLCENLIMYMPILVGNVDSSESNNN